MAASAALTLALAAWAAVAAQVAQPRRLLCYGFPGGDGGATGAYYHAAAYTGEGRILGST